VHENNNNNSTFRWKLFCLFTFLPFSCKFSYSSVKLVKSHRMNYSCHDVLRTYSNVKYADMVFVYRFCDKKSIFWTISTLSKWINTMWINNENVQKLILHLSFLRFSSKRSKNEHISTGLFFLSILYMSKILTFKFQTSCTYIYIIWRNYRVFIEINLAVLKNNWLSSYIKRINVFSCTNICKDFIKVMLQAL